MNTEEKGVSKKNLLIEKITRMEDEKKIRAVYYWVLNMRYDSKKE